MTQAIQKLDPGAIMEQVIAVGDLDRLAPAQRVTYYNKVCESVGLNPFTRPFEYIKLNGKLTLYARKDATDQMRAIHGVSVQIVSRERMDDVYVVTARATLPGGRQDESTGVVALGSLKGEALANALMKAETKAKRRVTLSVCGLGFLDESEVSSIPDAKTVKVDPVTGEVSDAPPRITPGDPDEPGKIYADPPELVTVLQDAESLIGAGKYSAARDLLGRKGDRQHRPGSFPELHNKAFAADQMSEAYRRELGRFWARLNRVVEKHEFRAAAESSAKLQQARDDVTAAFIDPPDGEEDAAQ